MAALALCQVLNEVTLKHDSDGHPIVGHSVTRRRARHQEAMACAPRITRFANAPAGAGALFLKRVLEFP